MNALSGYWWAIAIVAWLAILAAGAWFDEWLAKRRRRPRPSVQKQVADELAHRRALRAVRKPLPTPAPAAVIRFPTQARGRVTR